MVIALLLAAGKSERFGRQDKLWLPLADKPLIQWPLEVLRRNPLIREIMVALPKGRTLDKCETFIGGNVRQGSVYRGLQKIRELKQIPSFVLIHNGANPFITDDEIFRCVSFLQRHRTIDGVAVGRRIVNTVKIVMPPGTIENTLNRAVLWETQTPQLVRFQPFLEAHKKARREKFESTDDLALLEWYGKKTAVIEASPHNFKITTPLDYELAKIIAGDLPRDIRVGSAEDTHFFSRKHRGLSLGGLYLPEFPKLKADSDGDIALHALASAISQAIGEGPLGTFANPLFQKGIRDSRVYLSAILKTLEAKNFEIHHVGLHFEGHTPRIDPLVAPLKNSLAMLLHIPLEKIGITAETGETKKQKLRCRATVTLRSV